MQNLYLSIQKKKNVFHSSVPLVCQDFSWIFLKMLKILLLSQPTPQKSKNFYYLTLLRVY